MKKRIEPETTNKLEEIIARLIEADETARQISETARNERIETEKNIEERKSEIRQKYITKATDRIEAMRKSEAEKTQEAADKLNTQSRLTAKKLAAMAEANTELWAEQIFNRVISD